MLDSLWIEMARIAGQGIGREATLDQSFSAAMPSTTANAKADE